MDFQALWTELRSPLAFAIVAFVSLLLKRFLKGEIESHCEPIAKEVREATLQIRDLQRDVKALWRELDHARATIQDRLGDFDEAP